VGRFPGLGLGCGLGAGTAQRAWLLGRGFTLGRDSTQCTNVFSAQMHSEVFFCFVLLLSEANFEEF